MLTRALLEAGGVDALVARAAPGMRLMPEADRAESLRQTLASRPQGEPVWLFGYGSLIWNPTVWTVEQRPARIEGWHRAFCLSTQAGRGTVDNPGLVLGLDSGGACTGIAFRLAEETLVGELTLLWRREMLTGSYTPRWVGLLDADGARFGSAIAFTINHAADQYAGNLALEVIVQRLATAAGELGSSAEYLFHTCTGLRELGIPDAELDGLAAQVAQRRAALALSESAGERLQHFVTALPDQLAGDE